MAKKTCLRCPVFTSILVSLLLLSVAYAQTALKQQFSADFKSGAVLVIGKAGILSVPPEQVLIPPSTYKGGALHPPGAVSRAMLGGNNARALTVGEKVNVQKININVKGSSITFWVAECDSCNGSNEPSSYKAAVVFQFEKGYLETADPAKLRDVISEVLPFDITVSPSAPSVVSRAAIVSAFISKDNPNDILELRDDKSFHAVEGGRQAYGQYEWSGDTLTLILGKRRVNGHLAGDILTDNEGKLWRASMNGAPGGSTQAAAAETPMEEPPPPPPPPPAEPVAPKTIEQGQTMEQVVAAFGQPVKIVKLKTKEIYFYKEWKVTFTNGKVSNVE